MDDIEVKTKPSPIGYITTAIIILIIDIAIIANIFSPLGTAFLSSSKIFEPIFVPQMNRPLYTLFIPILFLGIPFLVLPALIIVCVQESFNEAKIRKHSIFLNTINPYVDFSNIKRKDANHMIGQLHILKDYKKGLGIGTLDLSTLRNFTHYASLNDKRDREKVYEVNKEAIMEKHPEIDFNNLTIKDRIIINDELDVLMYSKEFLEFK